MLLMFVVGTGSIGWMLALGAIMAIEKNVVWGRQVSAPLGAALLAWATLAVLVNIAPQDVDLSPTLVSFPFALCWRQR